MMRALKAAFWLTFVLVATRPTYADPCSQIKDQAQLLTCIALFPGELPLRIRLQVAEYYSTEAKNAKQFNEAILRQLKMKKADADDQIQNLQDRLVDLDNSAVTLYIPVSDRERLYMATDALGSVQGNLAQIIGRISATDTMADRAFTKGALEFLNKRLAAESNFRKQFAALALSDKQRSPSELLALARPFLSVDLSKMNLSQEQEILAIQSLRNQFFAMEESQRKLVGQLPVTNRELETTAKSVVGVATFLEEGKQRLQRVVANEDALHEQINSVTGAIQANATELQAKVDDSILGVLQGSQLTTAVEAVQKLDQQNRFLMNFVSDSLRSGGDFNAKLEQAAKQVLTNQFSQLGINPALQATLQKSLETRFDLSQNFKEFVQRQDLSIPAVAQTLKDVGVQPEVIATGMKAYQAVNGIRSVAASLATGNYVQMASSIASAIGLSGIPGVGGFFGGGGSDDAEQLAAINQKLAEISAQLRDLDKKVTELTNMVARDHAETMYMLDRINTNVLYATRQLGGLLRDSFSACNTLSELAGSDFQDDDKRAAWVSIHDHTFTDCSEKVSSAIKEYQISPYFDMRSYDRDYKFAEAYSIQVSAPLLRYFYKVYSTKQEQDKALGALENVSLTSWDLQRKGEILKEIPECDLTTERNYRDFISPEAAKEYVGYVLLLDDFRFRFNYQAHPPQLIKLKDFDPGYFSSQTVKDQTNVVRAEGIRQLKQTLFMLNTAISQQSMLGGDILLDKAVSDFTLDSTGSITDASFGALLNNDFILAENTALEWLTKVFGGDSLSYAVAARSDDEQYFRIAILNKGGKVDNVRFQKKDGRWYWVGKALQSQPTGDDQQAKVIELAIPLPTDVEFAKREYHSSADLLDLLQMREQVIERLASYDEGGLLDRETQDQILLASMLKKPN